MIYPTLPIEAAREALSKREISEPWSGTSLVRWVGDGPKFDEAKAVVLLEKLKELKEQVEAGSRPSKRGMDFEGLASGLVHESLGLCPRAAGSREFWLWLTFVAADGGFADLVDWRFSGEEKINSVNYGIGRQSVIWEGLFARLWLRGNIGHDSASSDPYRIAKKGDIDIWRSHIIRQEYGRCRSVAHALINYQYPDGKSGRPLTVKQLRDLAKRLRMVDASMSYELLPGGRIKDLIETNVERIKSTADSTAGESEV